LLKKKSFLRQLSSESSDVSSFSFSLWYHVRHLFYVKWRLRFCWGI
jgi:hypothetical protein